MTYVTNNQGSIPNYGKRRRQGKRIATSFVESTVNVLIGKRFAKSQQMQWSKQGAHHLLRWSGKFGQEVKVGILL